MKGADHTSLVPGPSLYFSRVRRRVRFARERALTYEKAMELSLALEAAEKDTRVMKAAVAGNGTAANGTPQPRVPQILYNGKPTASPRNPGFNKPIICLRCGENHLATVCKYRNTECSKCKKKGHLAKVCLSVGKPGAHVQQQYKRQANKPYKPSKNHYLEGTSDHEEDAYSLFMMKSAKSTDPITLNMLVNSVPVQMKLDTGASFSVISESTYKRICKNEPLQESTIRLNTYTGEAIQVLGKLAVKVSHGDQEAELWVQVAGGTGPDLVGRDWLSEFRFTLYNMQALEKPHSELLRLLLKKHSKIFSEDLGSLQGMEVKLHVDPTAKPKFFRARTVPYIMREKVEKELERLQSLNIISPVQFSPWAAPIVPVLKHDGSMRICGDYKITINQASKVESYPLPRVDELFSALSGGKYFTKLDMSQAYLQLPLDKDSQELVTINTHKGLFRYHRLPFGVSSAPAIFQRTIESILQGLKCVSIYIDDILVTGTTVEDHLENVYQLPWLQLN